MWSLTEIVQIFDDSGFAELRALLPLLDAHSTTVSARFVTIQQSAFLFPKCRPSQPSFQRSNSRIRTDQTGTYPPYSRHSRERSRGGLYSSPSPFLNLHPHPRPTSYTYVSDPAKGKYPSSTPPLQSRTSPSIPSTRLHRHLNTSPTSVVGAARRLDERSGSEHE